MRKCWERMVSLALSAVLCLGLLPTQALAALIDNTPDQNKQILEQLRALSGNEATAEQILAMLKEYGLVDEDGTIRTDWSGEIFLQEGGQPLTFAQAMELRQGAVTVNGRACDATRLGQALRAMEELGLLPGGAPAGEWELTVDGQPVAPAELGNALAVAQEDPGESNGPVVTALGTPVDGDGLSEVISFLSEYGLLTDTGVAADWSMTRPGEERAVTAEEITAMVEAGSLSLDAVVTVDGSPITVRDLQIILDIETELQRIQETYFPEGDVELSREQAQALMSLYNQLLDDEGFSLYNSQMAAALSAFDFPSGIDRTARVTLDFSGYSAIADSGGTFNVAWDVSDGSDVSFKLRVLNGSGTGLSFSGQSDTVLTCEGSGGTQALSLASWDTGWGNDELWNGQHVVFVQAYDLEGALFSNEKDSITYPLVLSNEKSFASMPIQWTVTNDERTFNLNDSQKYLLRNGVISDGQWSYTTSGYPYNTCYATGGAVSVKDSLWRAASISFGLASINNLNTYYYQYLKVTALVDDTQILGKEVGYPSDVAAALNYDDCFSFGSWVLQAYSRSGTPQYVFYHNTNKSTAVTPVADSNPSSDSVSGASGSLSQKTLGQMKQADSVTLSASGKWTAVGSNRRRDYGFNETSYGLRVSNETAANVTVTVTLEDNKAPTVTGIVFPAVSAGEEFPAGTQVPVTVTFSELVQSDGVTITANGVTCDAVEEGTSSKTLTFLYPVSAVDNRFIKVTAVNGVEDISGNAMGSVDISYQSGDILGQTPILRDAVESATLTIQAGELTYTPESGDQPDKTTAAVTVELLLPTVEDTSYWQQFRDILTPTQLDEEGRYVSTALEGVVTIGGENRVIPLVLDDPSSPTKLAATFEIDVLDLLDSRNFVLELREIASGKWIFHSYAPFSIEPPVPLTAADIDVILPNDWPEENVFVNAPPEGLKLSATLTGSGYTWSQHRWYSSDESVASIDPLTGEISLYGPGEVDFYVRAWNGDLEEYQDKEIPAGGAGTYSKWAAHLSVGEGGAPYLTIPERALTARAGEDVTLRWASNLVQKNMEYAQGSKTTTFTLEVYRGRAAAGTPVQTHTIVYDPAQPDGTITMGNGETLPMWIANAEGVLTPNQSFALSGLTEITASGGVSYTLLLTASTAEGVPGGPQEFTQTATVTILSWPVTATLERPGNFYQINNGTLPLTYTLTNFDAANNGEYQLTVTDNATGQTVDCQASEPVQMEDGTYTGTFTINLGAVHPQDGFRTIYDVSLQAKNPAEDAWSRDSITLYIYDQDALSIQVQSVTRDGVPVVTVNGDTVTMSNEDWIASLSQEEILALNRDIDLQTQLSINYAEHPWGEASDRVTWSSEASDVAAVNYPQGAYYEDIGNLPYTDYAPATEFLLSGKDDGTTVVEAIHALAGNALSDQVEVTVETLKDKLYLFQFYPAGTVQFSYISGDGQTKTGTTDAEGRAAVYEASGIASNVYAEGVIGGEKYLGTVYQSNLVSQERDAVSLELYPLNTITMRKAATLPVYLKNPDGTPFTGQVKIRAGVYRNGEWCEEAYVDPKNNLGNLGKTEDFTARFVDGAYTFQFDPTQFSTDSQPNAETENPVTAVDDIQFVLEIRADGYYPVLFAAYGSLNEDDAVRLAQRVVNLEAVPAGQENKPYIVRQAVYFSGSESGIGTDVRNKSGKVGPSAAYPNLLLSTTVFWWSDSGEGNRTIRYVDETGTVLSRQTATENAYPFCSMPVSHVTVPLDETQLQNLNVASLGTRTLKLQYISDGILVKDENMPWLFTNALALENVTQSQNLRESVEAMARLLATTNSDGVSVGNDFSTLGIALATQMNISVPLVTMKLSPTKDPTTFRGLIAVGLNNFEDDNVSGVDADGGRGSDLDATPGLDALKGVYNQGVGGYLTSLGNQLDMAAQILDGNIRNGISGGTMTTDRKPYFAIQGWFEIEVTFDFTQQKWVFTTLTGGATGGAGLGYEWTWNFMDGPIPLVAQLELGAAASLSFTSLWNPEDQGEDYLTRLRLYAYLQFFGGIGFDYAIVALKLGMYGRLGLEAQIEWLNRANGEVWDGQKLDVTGEVGVKFQVEALYFISYEKILWSHDASLYSGTFGSDFEKIEDYWDEALTGAGVSSEFIQPSEEGASGSSRAARASLLTAAADGIGIYSADLNATFLDRDYLQAYTRSYDTSAPTLEEEQGFSLIRFFANIFGGGRSGSAVVSTLENSYSQAGPILSDDGEYLFYLSDLDDPDNATAVRVAYMERNSGNAGYTNAGVVDDNGFGDSGLSVSGSGDDVAAVWSRVMEKPAVTEPGQSVTTDIQAQMMNDSDIMVAIPDGDGWKVTNLTDGNGVGDLAPVVTRKGNTVFVSWRQVASTDAMDVTNFNARDYIYYAVSTDGGESWSDPAPIYNGTSGSVKGIEAAMLPDGTAAVAFTLEGAGQNLGSGQYNQNVAYAVVGQDDSGRYDVLRYAVMEDENLSENPQLAAVTQDGTPIFILGWHSVSAQDGSSDIRLAAVDGQGNRITGFVDALSDLISNSNTTVSANFQFVQNADTLDDLSILWSGTVDDETSGGAGEGASSKGVIYGLRFRTVEENGYTKVSVTAAQQLMEMPAWTTVDNFSAYVDGSGNVRAAIQGTYYDYENPETVSVVYDDGTTGTVSIPGERTSLLTSIGAYTDDIRVDSVIPDYEHIRKGSSVPVQISLTNLGTQPIRQVTVTIGGQSTTFDSNGAFTEIGPGQVRALTAFYTVPSGENTAIPNPEYTVSVVFADGTQASSSETLALNVPDLGIADTDILLESADGDRVLQFTLFNSSGAELAGSNRSVKLAVYSDPACTKPIDTKYFQKTETRDGGDGVLLTVDGAQLSQIDEGSYTVQFRFDLASYIQQELNGETPFSDEDGEVRDGGVTLYAKVWVEGTDTASGQTGELVEYVTTNNSASVRMDSLLKQADGRPVTIVSQLSQSQDGGTQVDVTLRNNSIVNSQDGNLIVTLYDARGNRLAVQQSYTAGSGEGGLVSLSPEEHKTITFYFAERGAARADVTYSKTMLEESNNGVTQLYFQGIPITLESFAQREVGVFAASVSDPGIDSTWVNVVTANPNAVVTVNDAEMPLGGTGVSLFRGRNVITVTVTAPDGSQTTTYELTIDNSTPPGGSGSSYYSVDVVDPAHATVAVSPSSAQPGQTVAVTVTPDEGYAVDRVSVTGSDDVTVPVSDNGDGAYTFVMPAGEVTVTATVSPIEPGSDFPFVDVPEGAYYRGAVQAAYGLGLIQGTSETTFGPLLASTRSQVVAILYRLEGSPAVSGSNPFVDATADWVRDAVLWASQNGIVEGYSDTAFGPDDTITREQLAAILYRYASYKSYDLAVTGDLSIFDDASDVTAWSHTPLAWAVGKGLVQGSNNLVDPQGSAIRAQLAVILMRFLENVAV